MKPSISQFLDWIKNFSNPLEKSIFEYVINNNGVSLCFSRIDFTKFRQSFGVTPELRAFTNASWIIGPSAIGSENGTPISIMSTPERINCSIIFLESSSVG